MKRNPEDKEGKEVISIGKPQVQSDILEYPPELEEKVCKNSAYIQTVATRSFRGTGTLSIDEPCDYSCNNRR